MLHRVRRQHRRPTLRQVHQRRVRGSLRPLDHQNSASVFRVVGLIVFVPSYRMSRFKLAGSGNPVAVKQCRDRRAISPFTAVSRVQCSPPAFGPSRSPGNSPENGVAVPRVSHEDLILGAGVDVRDRGQRWEVGGRPRVASSCMNFRFSHRDGSNPVGG